jgi:hypothetical protein
MELKVQFFDRYDNETAVNTGLYALCNQGCATLASESN